VCRYRGIVDKDKSHFSKEKDGRLGIQAWMCKDTVLEMLGKAVEKTAHSPQNRQRLVHAPVKKRRRMTKAKMGMMPVKKPRHDSKLTCVSESHPYYAMRK